MELGTITIRPIIRPAILRTIVKGRPNEYGYAESHIQDDKVLVHMLGGIHDGLCIVEYEDGTLHTARYDRLAFTDNLHDEYGFE